MQKVYRTAKGKVLNMSELAARNEKSRAVGNMKVNARGDTIDSTGKIIEPVTSKVANRNAKTVGNRSAQPVKKAPPARKRPRNEPIAAPKPSVVNKTIIQPPKKELEELSSFEKELEEEMEDDIYVEKLKANETFKPNDYRKQNG